MPAFASTSIPMALTTLPTFAVAGKSFVANLICSSNAAAKAARVIAAEP